MDTSDQLLIYEWKANYCKKALLVRVLRNPQDKKYSRSHDKIEKVKFFTKRKDLHGISEAEYNCSRGFQIFELECFYDYVNHFLKPFQQAEITVKYWKEIVTCIELFDFRYEQNERVEFWSSTKDPKKVNDLIGAVEDMTIEQKRYLSAFGAALITDMKGQGRWWIDELIKIILSCIESDPSMPYIEGFAPSQHDNSNTVIETVFGDSNNRLADLQYSAPYFSTPSSNSSSLSSRSSVHIESAEYMGLAEPLPKGTGDSRVKRCTIVPDYCVALPEFPGIFPLVFKLSPAYEESPAFVQNIQQMLSKLFFQDVVFGVVVSPRSFQLSVIIKTDKDLHFASTHPIPIIQYRNDGHMLNLKKLDTMCNFIYGVLRWTRKTKCLLKSQYSGGEKG